ncbi:acetylornithine deacetylase [Vibrio nigripulchritudo SFn27]|uniref:Acetylornithine deacetylase n=1 Tax=Vibrio nigripulchritudo TaxID=28173 RepID=U4KFL3_9VIBR|nr:acetylornithine deacetylase [Vibrio nigripulchritudo]CCN85551.1 acetylornithine deacetylase [Vibrio nigripulchritudo BLFn1]CCN88981.1 acetylornithine deacetylase [Vibrio nigripulchritudo SFn27]CCN95518.1 acetylornithine deacetylase [Vibrio nigripulchritudo ENn2]CCO43276.1 acetylornithine deacetylase [Vibrio nigripulchritudo SFn135]CCO54438.1 acetylornithine deacetylase [Vibrio nigripulchritudo Wn13]
MQLPGFIDIYGGLISTSSISSSDPSWDEGNSEVIAKLATWFEDLGFETQVVEVEKGKHNLIAKMGKGEGGLLLAGHTDTVPFDEGRWNYDPHALTEANDRFYGLGTADMKGFFAFILEAVKKTDWSQQTKPLYVLATCDEETTMLGARHFTEDAPFKPDYCIIGEPTSLVPIRAHKGHVANAIRVTGHSGHSSNPALGVNAIEVMHEVLFALMKLRDDLIKAYHHPGFDIPNPTLNLGHIHGGDSANRICGCCELHYDVRPLPGISIDGLDNMLREALKEVEAKWPGRIEIKPLHEPIPGYECDHEHPFIEGMERICEQPSETVNYCTEAPFLQQLCPTLVLGPGSIDQAHQPDEFLAFEFIDPTIKILDRAIHQYCF